MFPPSWMTLLKVIVASKQKLIPTSTTTPEVTCKVASPMRLHTINILLKYLSRATPRGTVEEQEFFEALQELQRFAQQISSNNHKETTVR